MHRNVILAITASVARNIVAGADNFTVRLALPDGRKYESVVSFDTHGAALSYAIDMACDSPETSAAWERVHVAASTITIIWPSGDETTARSAL